MEIRVCSYNAILSIDGKIAMECYGRVFDFFSRCIAAHLQHAHADGLFNNGLHFEEVSFSAFIITPPLALAIATMGTANAFGLFLLAPITDVLSHWCLGATPGVFITFDNVKIDFASASVGFWAAGTCQDGGAFHVKFDYFRCNVFVFSYGFVHCCLYFIWF